MRNATSLSASADRATITHPFHPLRGQSFFIRHDGRRGDIHVVTLRREDGTTLVVPAEWTDRALPHSVDAGGTSTALDALALLAIVEIVQHLRTRTTEQQGKVRKPRQRQSHSEG
jgi:hypothetical protein